MLWRLCLSSLITAVILVTKLNEMINSVASAFSLHESSGKKKKVEKMHTITLLDKARLKINIIEVKINIIEPILWINIWTLTLTF